MDHEKGEYYTQLHIFTNEITLIVLHHYFEIRVLDKDTFCAFLNRCKDKLYQRLNSKDFGLLFDIKNSTLQCPHDNTVEWCACAYSASKSVTVNRMDVSLVCAIINTCCSLTYTNLQWIKDVVKTRNFLAHPSSRQLTKDEYDTSLKTVENATLNLAKLVSSSSLKMIQKHISYFKNDMPSYNTVKDIQEIKELVFQNSKSMEKNIIDLLKTYTDELFINFNELIFEVKTHVCEKLPSQIEESGETGYATSTPQTAQPESTQSKNDNKCRVEWKLATPNTWNVSKMKNTLERFSSLLNEWFEIEFVYIGSLVIRTKVPEHILSNYDDFKSAVEAFLAKIVEVCQLDTDTHTVVKVDLSIFTEIPTEISTNVNKEHKKSTLTSPCHYCKEELVCDNCTTDERIELPVSFEKLSISGFKTDSDSVTCKICGKTFKNERGRLIHHGHAHKGFKTDSDSACYVCGETIETEKSLNVHYSCVHTV